VKPKLQSDDGLDRGFTEHTSVLQVGRADVFKPSPCPCCGQQMWTDSGSIRASYAASKPELYLPVLSCERCGVRRLGINPSPGRIEEYYASTTYGLRAYSESRSHHFKMFLEAGNNRLIRAVRGAVLVTWLPRPPFLGAKMLDIGCARGDLMAHAARLGWTASGCEASDASCAVARSRGFECFTSDWESHLPSGEFHLVTLSHVLEHLPSPVSTLGRLRQSMTTDAYLLCTLPNWDSDMARIFDLEWWANNPPEHIWLLRPHDTDAILKSAGFRVELVRLRSRWLNLAQLVPRGGVMASQWAASRACGSSQSVFRRRYLATVMRALSAALNNQSVRSALTYCTVARPVAGEIAGSDNSEN
jgi:SAM-dependent methyltransferase